MNMDMTSSLGVVAVIGLASVHIVSGNLGLPSRSAWLSAAAGTSVAYVFVHLLPELAARQTRLGTGSAAVNETEIYIAALTGLIFFYGVEQLNRHSRRRRSVDDPDKTSTRVFWISTSSYALWNSLLGYGLGRRSDSSLTELLLFTVVIGMHFLINDAALRGHHKDDYDRVGRWVLAGAILLGWAASRVIEVSEFGVGLLYGGLAGGIVLNVLKHELPEDQGTSLWAFAAGAVGYAVLLLVI